MARGQAPPLLPDRLVAARRTAGLTQQALAEALGVSHRTIVQYEKGRERPEIQRLAALARALGAPIADLVAPGSLPEGLAGLRLGAGLTLAAAADAVRAQLPAGGGIACSRPVLADAERGVLPPTWAPPPAAGAVRTALGAAYDTDVEMVAAAWKTTFPTQTDLAPAPGWDPLPETLWVWLCAAAAAPGATTAELGGPYWLRHLVEGPVKGSPRQGRGFLVRRPAPSGVPQEETWHLTEAGRAHIRDHRDDYARLYPDTAPAVLPDPSGASAGPAEQDEVKESPGLRPAAGAPLSETSPLAAADAELPFADPAPEPEVLPSPEEGAVHLELLTPEQTDATGMGAARMWRVCQGETPVGYVWRTDDAHQQWAGARAGARAGADGRLGDIASLTPALHRTRRSVVEHLLDPDAPYFTAPDPRAPAAAASAAPQQDGTRAVAVLLTGDPGEEHPYLWVHVDGERIGHLGPRHSWDLVEGWVYYSRPTAEELRTLPSAELGGRPPEAVTTLTDPAAAARELLDQVLEDGVYVGSLHGHHTGPDGVHPDRMARWELYRGRVPGRHDIYTGSTCHGWLQDAPEGGHTAHTRSGPVTGGPWPTRGEAVAALWGHLTAPLPPPRLSEQVHARRTPRKRFDLRPMCPYTDAQLAAHRVVEAEGSEKGARVYEVRVADDLVGRVRRLAYVKKHLAWEATAATRARPGEATPPRTARGTREDAVWALLARPGPLWADPTSETLHGDVPTA
ncbi:DNA-binding transcriptional regulator, XRE-family HTH domain [Nocardiopsis flavescens]|uniref:DNA-binding transcriptional regulator, XRE-family HTH domain n=1 Tax=Nocardiopsis flavescens TaxID=758803 RepID=A0A1M6WLG6_9ACTN|nr:helix-turn-helix transcriptional regulator [Nocardiopsis flavescens]SHK94429.1 DNA-binding transcriptional regulator, XRE-family HTH domain [Nocardiopsis flavescens]